MNATRMARLMAERYGAMDGAKRLDARANYYARLADARVQDHRRLTRNEYAFRAMYWRSAGRVCIAKYSHKIGAGR
jgi:hypothetical protein